MPDGAYRPPPPEGPPNRRVREGEQPSRASVGSVTEAVAFYLASMSGLSGSITLHIHQGKVTRIEKVQSVAFATSSP